MLGCLLSWYPWVLHPVGRPGNGGPNPLGLLVGALIAAAVDGGWRGPVGALRSMVRLRAPARVRLVALINTVGAGYVLKMVAPPTSRASGRSMAACGPSSASLRPH
ncbi:MAG TPA: hypothetical protein VG889_10220 [Rhizomicrobium sp.]|nr:hypothetical protein [Rhizomicrobium sp.]